MQHSQCPACFLYDLPVGGGQVWRSGLGGGSSAGEGGMSVPQLTIAAFCPTSPARADRLHIESLPHRKKQRVL